MSEPYAANQDGQELVEVLRSLETGPPIRIGDGAFVPLLLRRPGPDADLLDEGIRSGFTEITEVSERGAVNRVRVSHRGRRSLLLIDGEQLLGAKQNRVFNATYLVPPGAEVDVPVSCVERRRWGYTSTRFSTSKTTLHSLGRRRKLGRVASSVAAGRGYDAGQKEVWRDVAQFVEEHHASAPSEAFEDAARLRQGTTEHWLGLLAPRRHQVGLAVVRERRLTVMDLFGSSDLFARAWQKIASGMLADITDDQPPAWNATTLLQEALAELVRATWTRSPAPGSGETLHGWANGLVVGALVHDGALYHAVAAS